MRYAVFVTTHKEGATLRAVELYLDLCPHSLNPHTGCVAFHESH